MTDKKNKNAQSFVEYLSQFAALSPEIADIIMQHTELKEYKKNELIFRQGNISNYMYFIQEGALRVFSDAEGQEVTIWLETENSMAAALHSFLSRQPSDENIQAVEDSKIYRISYASLQKLYDAHHVVERLGRLMVEKYAIRLREHSFSLRNHTTLERYQNLLAKQPDFLQRFSLSHIASFLGMTIQALSMARAKIR